MDLWRQFIYYTFFIKIYYTSTLAIAENTSAGIAIISSALPKLNVYPNPVSDNLNIEYTISNSTQVEVKMFDMLGNVVDVFTLQTKVAGNYVNNFKIDRNKYRKGIYFVELITNDTKSTQKILID